MDAPVDPGPGTGGGGPGGRAQKATFGRTCPGIPHSALGIPERQAGPIDSSIVNRVLEARREILRAELDCARGRLNQTAPTRFPDVETRDR